MQIKLTDYFGKIRLKACVRIIIGYLRSKKIKFLPNVTISICIFAISISIATLIITKSVMNGFRNELINAIISINSHINLYTKDYRKDYIKIEPNYTAYIEENEDKIQYSGGIITKTGMLMYKENSSGILIKGFEMKDFKKRPKIASIAIHKDFEKNPNCILIGKDLALKNRIHLNDYVKIIIPKVINTMFGSFPVTKEYKFCGYIQTDAVEYDSLLIIMHADEMRTLFNIKKGEFSNIELFIKNYEKTEEITDEIYKNFPNKFLITDWKIENRSLINALKTESSVMFLILSLFIFVSILSVFLSIRNLIKEKVREIAILTTMGFTKNEISFIFFNISFFISIIGVVIGSILGILFSLNIQNIKQLIEKLFNINLFESVYLLAKLPSEVRQEDVASTIIFVLFFSLLFSLILAKMSLKNKAFDVLKHY